VGPQLQKDRQGLTPIIVIPTPVPRLPAASGHKVIAGTGARDRISKGTSFAWEKISISGFSMGLTDCKMGLAGNQVRQRGGDEPKNRRVRSCQEALSTGPSPLLPGSGRSMPQVSRNRRGPLILWPEKARTRQRQKRPSRSRQRPNELRDKSSSGH
jgi:hypothetical protein